MAGHEHEYAQRGRRLTPMGSLVGHPFGMAGARIMTAAMIVERLA